MLLQAKSKIVSHHAASSRVVARLLPDVGVLSSLFPEDISNRWSLSSSERIVSCTIQYMQQHIEWSKSLKILVFLSLQTIQQYAAMMVLTLCILLSTLSILLQIFALGFMFMSKQKVLMQQISNVLIEWTLKRKYAHLTLCPPNIKHIYWVHSHLYDIFAYSLFLSERIRYHNNLFTFFVPKSKHPKVHTQLYHKATQQEAFVPISEVGSMISSSSIWLYEWLI